MNPMLLTASFAEPRTIEQPIVPAEPDQVMLYDRAYIAALCAPANGDMLVYHRAPLADEWAGPITAGAEVVVYVVNDWTVVRTLQDATGRHLCEPKIDSWLLYPTAA